MTDYSQYTKDDGPSGDSLRQLSNLAEHLRQAEEDVAAAEEKLKAAKKREQDLAEHQIPELMESIGMSEFKTTSGLRLQLKAKIRCGKLESTNRPDAIRWLEEHHHDGMIKRTFTILFGKDDKKWANKFAADLRKRKKPLDSRVTEEVHAATLASFLEKQIEAGADVPLDLFGAFRQRRAAIIRSKQNSL